MNQPEQFTYKQFDIETGIVFTNLSCDVLHRFNIDMLHDLKARKIFNQLTDYIANNIEIKEEE